MSKNEKDESTIITPKKREYKFQSRRNRDNNTKKENINENKEEGNFTFNGRLKSRE